jgi:hypothetical protein
MVEPDERLSPLGRLSRFLRLRLGVIKEFTVFQYEVRLSGIVLPPAGNLKKQPEEKTAIQWEISFETQPSRSIGERGEPPFFRTFTPEWREAQKRFEASLIELVRRQEMLSRFVFSRASNDIGIFSWKENVDVNRVPQRALNEYFKNIDDAKRFRIEQTGIVKVGKKPNFRIDAISFQPIDSFIVTSDRLKEFSVYDRYYFKVYRPDEDVEFNMVQGEFNHPL